VWWCHITENKSMHLWKFSRTKWFCATPRASKTTDASSNSGSDGTVTDSIESIRARIRTFHPS
jgi:hypothetical protein